MGATEHERGGAGSGRGAAGGGAGGGAAGTGARAQRDGHRARARGGGRAHPRAHALRDHAHAAETRDPRDAVRYHHGTPRETLLAYARALRKHDTTLHNTRYHGPKSPICGL